MTTGEILFTGEGEAPRCGTCHLPFAAILDVTRPDRPRSCSMVAICSGCGQPLALTIDEAGNLAELEMLTEERVALLPASTRQGIANARALRSRVLGQPGKPALPH
jgi:hypothetical protein